MFPPQSKPSFAIPTDVEFAAVCLSTQSESRCVSLSYIGAVLQIRASAKRSAAGQEIYIRALYFPALCDLPSPLPSNTVTDICAFIVVR